jgi:hypothetical protein
MHVQRFTGTEHAFIYAAHAVLKKMCMRFLLGAKRPCKCGLGLECVSNRYAARQHGVHEESTSNNLSAVLCEESFS